ncbi:MAG: Spo0E family sporulation regulatory protein-aspartic acid phosphatase [Planifilum sp.]
MKTIEQDMERMREKLYRTISQNGFRLSADEVLSVSRQLDELILEFYKKKEIGATERSYPG